jgi:hypothetical protein
MRTSLTLTAALVALLVLPSLAAAKGPSKASMSGPGINGVRHLTGNSEGGPGTALGALTMEGGFFPQVFGQQPDPTRTDRPKGDLGPRFSIRYDVPGPGGASVLRQDFYPYARPAPLTYMKPDQTFWDGQKTHGGWFVADTSLRGRLGLPARPPLSSSGGTHIWRWLAVGAGALVPAAALAFVIVRRRPHAKPVSA